MAAELHTATGVNTAKQARVQPGELFTRVGQAPSPVYSIGFMAFKRHTRLRGAAAGVLCNIYDAR